MTKTILYILVYAAFNVSGAALIKWQLRDRSLVNFKDWFAFVLNPPFIIAFSLIVISALALFKALSSNSFSLIIPLATGINFILTVGVSYYLFEDKLSIFSFFGFALIIGGIIVLSLTNNAHAQQNF